MAGQPASIRDQFDRRLGEAIDAYLEQRQRGEPVSPEQWAQRYPEIADELRECLAALPLLERGSAAAARAPAAGVTDEEDLHRPAAAGERPAIPGYTILAELGRGGMGVVYRAIQHATRREVALKLLASGTYASPAARRRFEREIELAAALDHPGIVHVYDAGEHKGQLYCAMALVEGEPLNVWAGRRAASVRQKLELFIAITEAVQYAHQRAVIHRDLKPSNIMIDRDDRPRILDFGLAREVEPPLGTAAAAKAAAIAKPSASEARPAASGDASQLTREGQLVGTLPYLSPEQATGAGAVAVDTRSDLYALGVILFELLTGRLPYDTSGPLAETLQHICRTVPPRPSRLGRGLDANIDAVVLRALEKSPEHRHHSAAELLDDLRCCLSGEPVSAHRTSRFYLLRKVYARHRRQVQVAFGAMVLLLLTATVIAALYVQVRRERNQLDQQLHITQVRRGLAQLAAGHDMLAERTLWAAYRRRPDEIARWSLLAYFVENPLAGVLVRTGWVTGLSFSRDGRYVACSNLDGEVLLYDADTFARAATLQAHAAGPTHVAFAPGGELLATAGSDGQLKHWRTGSWQPVAQLEAHAGGVTLLRYAASANRLLTIGVDGRLRVWEPPGAEPVWETAVASAAPSVGDLSAAGEIVATTSGAAAVRIVDVQSGGRLAELPAVGAAVEALRFSPDGRLLAAWSAGQVGVWSWASGTRHWSAAAGASEPRPTSLWDRAPGRHVTWTPSLEFSEDGALLLASGWDAIVRAWRTDRGESFAELRSHGTAVYALALQSGSGRLMTGQVGDVRIWDLRQHPAARSWLLPSGATCVAISAAGRLVASGNLAGNVRLHAMGPPSTDMTLALHAPVTALAFDPSGGRLAAADDDGRVALWDAVSGERLGGFEVGASVRALALWSDARQLAAGDVCGDIHLWNASASPPVAGWHAHDGPVLALSFSPNGAKLVSGGADWQAKLWEVGRRGPPATRRHGEWVNAVAFSPDGARIASAGADLAIRVGRMDAGPALEVAPAHGHWVTALAFVDAGRVLVSGGNDAAIRFWDARTGQELATLSSRWGPVRVLDIDRQAQVLVVATDRAAQLIDLKAAEARVRSLAP